jgi:hypothetical protein
MQPARFIARLIGPTYLAIGVGILLNGSFYTGLVEEAVRSASLIYFSGLMAILSGLAILNVHRAWHGWQGIITIIGWLLTIAGVLRLVLPATTASYASDLYERPATLLIVAALMLIVGVILTIAGYRSAPDNK